MTRTFFDTPLEAARDDDREWTWMLSDLHVDRDGGAELAHLFAVLARARARAERARVFILGDLFEFYATPGQLRLHAWKEVGDALRETAAAGVSVTLLRGNRDYLLDGRFARATGCRVVPGGVVVRLDGRRVVLLHGDELCLRDVAYQKSKRWLRSWPMWWLSWLLPTPAAVRVGAAVRGSAKKIQNRRAVRVPRAGDDPHRFDPVAEAVAAALEAARCDALVFGHVHAASRSWFPAPSGPHEVVVLPAFDERGVHLVSGPGAPLAFVDGGGVALAAPVDVPTRVFPSVDAPGAPVA